MCRILTVTKDEAKSIYCDRHPEFETVEELPLETNGKSVGYVKRIVKHLETERFYVFEMTVSAFFGTRFYDWPRELEEVAPVPVPGIEWRSLPL
jgi:hypothetical protein